MSTRLSLLALGACASLLLTACGGGGGSSPTPLAAATSGGSSSNSRTSASATATIRIPKRIAATLQSASRSKLSVVHVSSAKRSPNYIDAATQSVQITSTRSDGWAESSTTAVGPNAAGCTTGADGSTTCIVPFSAPATSGTQTDDIVINLYDAADPYRGNQLGYAEQANATVNAAASNTFSFVVGAVVANWVSLTPTANDPNYMNDEIAPTFRENGPTTTNLAAGVATTWYITATSWDQNQDSSDNGSPLEGGVITGKLDSVISLALGVNGTNVAWTCPATGSGYYLSTTTTTNDTLNITDTALFASTNAPVTWDGTGAPTLTVATNSLNSSAYAANYYQLATTFLGAPEFVTIYSLVSP